MFLNLPHGRILFVSFFDPRNQLFIKETCDEGSQPDIPYLLRPSKAY